MRPGLSLLLGIAMLSSCVARRPIARAAPEEAAWFKFNRELPGDTKKTIPGKMATAIQLAMDHFLPWDRKPSLGADPVSVCLLQRQSWNVYAVPEPDDLIWVQFSLGPGACSRHGPVADMGATYAIDARRWRILAIRHP